MSKNISIIFILTIYFLINSCGFKPIYKISDDNLEFRNYSVKIINQVSREVREEVSSNIFSEESLAYEVLLNIQEEQTPLIINSNGTVAKYRIEVSINFEIIKSDTKDIISNGTTRGFAQYDVGESEFNNEDLKKRMVRNAAKNSLQIMTSKVESSIARANDN